MRLEAERLKNKNQTGRKMYSLVKQYSDDLDLIFTKVNGKLVSVSKLPFDQFFNMVKSIPYQKDSRPFELLARPYISFKRALAGSGLDCKKKAVLIASWINKNYGPDVFRFVATSNRPDKKITHTYAEININGKWFPADATYSQNKIFSKNGITKKEVLNEY